MVILGRVVVEAVRAPGREYDRLQHRKTGARIARALPWPSRLDEAAEATV